MADNDGGDKTEKPTPKRLRDARKKGEVPKSKEIGTTFGLIFAMVVLWLFFGYAFDRLASLMITALAAADKDFYSALRTLASETFRTGLLLSSFVLIPIMLFAVFLEFLQTGPVMTIEKMKPKMSHLNPAEGLKRMFSADNLVELVKSILKTALLFIIVWVAISGALTDIVLLAKSSPLAILSSVQHLGIRMFGWTSVAFILLTAADTGYQHYSFNKKMKMSKRDIKQEYKDTEGDPMLKGHRRQLAQEWAQEGATQAAGSANVLVVNPTHVAIAIQYDGKEVKVPTITGRGEDEIARAMREAAEYAGVPILRNERLARTLLIERNEDNLVPKELFDIVAEVILWARAVKEKIDHDSIYNQAQQTADENRPAPGEDLTRYPILLPQQTAIH